MSVVRSSQQRNSSLPLSIKVYVSSVIKVAYLPADAGDAEDVTLAKRNDHVLELDNSAAPQLLGWVSRIPQESGSGVALGVAESTVICPVQVSRDNLFDKCLVFWRSHIEDKSR